jgi:hypothetical protein
VSHVRIDAQIAIFPTIYQAMIESASGAIVLVKLVLIGAIHL